MKNYKKQILRTTTCRKTYKIYTREEFYDPYPISDELWKNHNSKKNGNKFSGSKSNGKIVWTYKYRRWRSWKNTRNKQWKGS